ncbi:hypothetical protein DXG01_002587 [Tephrocybe rancida]|nr:hypothetical protein DXG01_002587 [Tephrocybe rancida]
MQQKAPHPVSTATTAPPVTEETINNNAMALEEEPMTLDNSDNEYELVKVKKNAPSKKPKNHNAGLESNWDAPNIELPPADTKIQENWDAKFSPRIIKYIGTLMPWTALLSKEHRVICKIWADVQLEDSDSNLSVIVFKKINDTITAWQHKFSATAEKYLMKSLFKQLKDDTQEYEEPHPDKPDLQIHVKGIFQSPILVATLSTHYVWLEKLETNSNIDEYLVGTLVLAIQACRCHISQWTTGSEVKPTGQLANFSANIWSDCKDCDGPSNLIDARLTTNVMDIVDQPEPKQWKHIAASAREAMKWQRKASASKLNLETEPRVKPKPFKLLDQDTNSNASNGGGDNNNA